MRVATYTDNSEPAKGSLLAHGVLLLTILMGTGVIPTVTSYFGGVLPQLVTPLWLVLYVVALLDLILKHGINWISWMARYRILLVVLLLGTVVSVSWSIDPRVSAERVVHLLGSSILAIYIGFSVPLLSTLRLFGVVLALMILASIGAALALPEMGIEAYEGTEVWRGVFISKNGLGFWSAVGVLLYINLSASYSAVSSKVLCLLMAVLCVGVLALSQSATSLVAMLIAGALSFYLYIAIRFQLGMIRMGFLAIMFIAITALAVSNIDTTELVGRASDLTGRGEVWEQVLKLIYQLPLKGTGYGALWFPTEDTMWIQQKYFDFTWLVFHAHNGLLQVASEIGIPLALVALLMVAQQLIEIFYCQYERQQVGVLFVLGFVVTYLISNYSEARFLVTRELFWIFFLALPISMLRQMNVVSAEGVLVDNSPDGNPADAQGWDSVVPGKPWLGPSPKDLTASSRQLAGTQGAGVLAHAATGSHTGAHSGSNQYDLVTSTLSLTEADLDLGDIRDDYHVGSALDQTIDHTLDYSSEHSLDHTLDLTEAGNEFGNGVQHSDKQALEFGPDDTFEVDRYDIEIDSSAQWVDIDLNKKI